MIDTSLVVEHIGRKMKNLELLDVLDYWSFWDKPIPSVVEREIELPDELSPSIAVVIQGVRRSGKSTLLSQFIPYYKLSPKDCAFINFEDPKLAQQLNTNLLDQIVSAFSEGKSDKKLYFFLDEIQHIENWEKWLHTKLERPDLHHFILTGSNASLLSGELSSALTGRHRKLELYPLSLREARKMFPNLSLQEYCNRGGFPAPLQSTEADYLLKQYFDDIIEKDIKNRLNARSSQGVRQVVQIAYESSGSEMSMRRVAGATGLAVDTVTSYIDAAQSAYLLFSCPFFSYSEKKRASRNKKFYPIDTGLRRNVVTRTGDDLGKMLETLVFLELKKIYSQVSYWKDKGEVDFVVESKQGLLPIQVSWEGVKDRHLNASENFYEHYPQALEMLFVTEENYDSFVHSLK